MNLYYRINHTHRWPSTANKHIQVVFWCEPAGQPGASSEACLNNNADVHTRELVFVTSVGVCVCVIIVSSTVSHAAHKHFSMTSHYFSGFIPIISAPNCSFYF